MKAVAVAVLTVSLAAPAWAQDACSPAAIEQGLDRILKMQALGVIYFEGGASDGSIVKQPPELTFCRPEIEPILRCEEKAAPVLIQHLDDVRLTAAKFWGSGHRKHPIRVPLGVVCLDMLLSISTTQSPTYDPATENDDTLGAGVVPKFYFRPDAYTVKNGVYAPKPVVLKAKANWQRALEAGQLKFEFSKWHRGEFD
jgi:hypothetical protein